MPGSRPNGRPAIRRGLPPPAKGRLWVRPPNAVVSLRLRHPARQHATMIFGACTRFQGRIKESIVLCGQKEWFGLRCAIHTPRKPTRKPMRKAISPRRLEKLPGRQAGAQTNAQVICSECRLQGGSSRPPLGGSLRLLRGRRLALLHRGWQRTHGNGL